MLIVLAGLAGYLTSLPNGADAGTWRLVILVIAAAVVIWWVVIPFLRWLISTYTFTNRRLITRKGLLTRRGHDIPLNRISDISYEKGLIDRIFGCGTLVISDASETGRVELHDIPRVEEVQLVLNDLVHARTTRSTAGLMTAPEDLERAIVGAVPDLTGEEVADPRGSPSSRPNGCGAPSASPRRVTRRRSARPTPTRSSGSPGSSGRDGSTSTRSCG